MSAVGPRVRLGIVLLSDRLSVAAIGSGRLLESFSVVNAEHPASALRAELDTRRLKNVRATRVAVPRSLVTVKPLELPPAVETDLRQMVQFEIERHVPFAAEDAAFDFLPLPRGPAGQRVIVVAAERRVVDRALQLMADAKLRPVSITVAALDLLHLLAHRPAAEQAVWIHRVGESADILLLAGGAVVLSRYVTVTDTEPLAEELRSTLSMLRWSDPVVWVSGDASDELLMSGALSPMAKSVGPPPLSPAARRLITIARSDLDGAEWLAVATAIARRVRGANLLPEALRPRHWTASQLLTAGLAAVTLLLGGGALVAQGLRDQRQLAVLNQEIRGLEANVGAVERTRTDLERKTRLLETVKAAGEGGLRALPVLRELTDTLPADAWLTALSLDTNGVELTGQAAAASSLISLLENSPRLERVEFVSPVTRGRDKEQFRIKAAWESPPTPLPAPRPAVTGPTPPGRGPRPPGSPPASRTPPRPPADGAR